MCSILCISHTSANNLYDTVKFESNNDYGWLLKCDGPIEDSPKNCSNNFVGNLNVSRLHIFNTSTVQCAQKCQLTNTTIDKLYDLDDIKYIITSKYDTCTISNKDSILLRRFLVGLDITVFFTWVNTDLVFTECKIKLLTEHTPPKIGDEFIETHTAVYDMFYGYSVLVLCTPFICSLGFLISGVFWCCLYSKLKNRKNRLNEVNSRTCTPLDKKYIQLETVNPEKLSKGQQSKNYYSNIMNDVYIPDAQKSCMPMYSPIQILPVVKK